jgi:glycosyltransferase involved in cell wall biosynthesis
MPELRFQIRGGDEGQLENYLRREVPPNVEWLRHVPHADIPLQEAACEVLLMPYQRKVTVQGKGDTAEIMSPLKLFEYMAAGRLIVASDLPALREVLNESNSVLLPPDSPLDWQRAIRRAQQDVPWRETLGRKAREDVTPYTWRNRVRTILESDRTLDHG